MSFAAFYLFNISPHPPTTGKQTGTIWMVPTQTQPRLVSALFCTLDTEQTEEQCCGQQRWAGGRRRGVGGQTDGVGLVGARGTTLTGPRRSMSSCLIWDTRASLATRARCRRSLNSISSPCISATCNTQAPKSEAGRADPLLGRVPPSASPSPISRAQGRCWAGSTNAACLRATQTRKQNTFLTWWIWTLWNQWSPVCGQNMTIAGVFWILGFCS